MMKPEKVKSRWRRSSEMEISEKSALCPNETVKELLNNSTTEKSDLKEIHDLSAIKEENLENSDEIPKYVELEENMYLFERKRTKRKKEVRRMLCECSLSGEERERGIVGCQDECLNKLLMIECGSRCATGEACSNKRFQKRLYAKVTPFKTEKKGWGLKLLEDVPMGNFVIEYVGEILNNRDFKQRVKQYAREKSNHYYFMSLKTDEIIDATNKGNLSRFMNHSCEPNCETQKWTVNGELRIGFFAKRELKAGEELTFDYQFQRYGREAQKCFCFAESCSGYIGVSNELASEVSNKTVNNKRKKVGMDDKRRESLEDLILEEEIEKLHENGGLQNKEETLILARLMVRAEDTHSRQKLLAIIMGTENIPFLQLFLEYHGLPLLWSWMVDVTDLKLKTKILQVLSILPVSNKEMLLESKVYHVVEKWSSNIDAIESNALRVCDDKNLVTEIKKTKSCDTSDSENDSSKSHSDEGSANNSMIDDSEDNCTTTIKGNSSMSFQPDEESCDLTDLCVKLKQEELLNLSQALLTTWNNLKEDFKMPLPIQQRPQFQEFTKYNQTRRSFVCRPCGDRGFSTCKHKIVNRHAQTSKGKQKNSYSQHEKNWYLQNLNEANGRPRKVLLPTPTILT